MKLTDHPDYAIACDMYDAGCLDAFKILCPKFKSKSNKKGNK
jgi:hypothetical protein